MKKELKDALWDWSVIAMLCVLLVYSLKALCEWFGLDTTELLGNIAMCLLSLAGGCGIGLLSKWWRRKLNKKETGVEP